MENLKQILSTDELEQVSILPTHILEKISKQIEEDTKLTEKNMERKFQSQLRKQQSSLGYLI